MDIASLRAMLATQLRKPLDDIHPSTRLVEDLGFDSIEMTTLLLAIDDACGVMPDAAQLSNVNTVAELHATVLGLLRTT